MVTSRADLYAASLILVRSAFLAQDGIRLVEVTRLNLELNRPAKLSSGRSSPILLTGGRPRRDRRATIGTSLMEAHAISINVEAGRSVSGLLISPNAATACLVLAHGAGAGMNHPFMTAVAEGLADRKIATLRYQFPFMEQGSKRPDRPALAHATVRAAVERAAELLPSTPLFAGGKSFGARMTSQAQAEAGLPQAQGLVSFGFPLYAAKMPSTTRAEHLAGVLVPMLFLQGTRDTLAELELLRPIIEGLGSRTTLSVVEGADHSFHVPARLHRTDCEVLEAMLSVTAVWMSQHRTQ